jgi:adenylate cyclase
VHPAPNRVISSGFRPDAGVLLQRGLFLMQSDKESRRKLAAILVADVAGYSRMMGEDEAATLATLNAYRDVFAKLIAERRGRIVDTAGDSVLAMFDSVVEAVQCATDLQQALAARNEKLPEARRMKYRVGVNLGDVIEQSDGSIYGDGVNIAARLQALADPGGIYVSRTAYDQIRNKLPLSYVSLGEKSLKHIAEPVEVFRILPLTPTGGEKLKKKRRLTTMKQGAIALIATLVLSGAVVATWQATRVRPTSANPSIQTALSLPEGPSIAVLPFQNMSGNPEEEWFSDGMTETLITDLSRLSNLFVIARNSTFVYKGKPVDVRQVGKELGVRYVLEGSVQRSDGRLRVNAQLIDAQTGRHIWAERYDRTLADVFKVQDDITRNIVTEMDVKLLQGEMVRSWRKSTRNHAAYDLSLKGAEHFYRWTREDMATAEDLFQRALDIDPKFTIGMTWLGWTLYTQGDNGWSADSRESYQKAVALGRRAIANDSTEGEGYSLLAGALLTLEKYSEAEAAADKARKLSPNNANILANTAWAFAPIGRSEEALQLVQRAIRLNPSVPDWYFGALGDSLLFSGKAEEAVAAHRKCVTGTSGMITCQLGLTAAYVETGKLAEATAQAREAMKINPGITGSDNTWVRGIRNADTRAHFAEALRSAGLK